VDIKVERTSKSSVRAFIDVPSGGLDWSLLLRSDAHHDNAHCEQDLEKRHLDQARAKGAGVLDIGDLFCAMQGTFDPRQDKDQLRQEDSRNDYFDRLVDNAAKFYRPYAKHFLMMSPGNHEKGVLKRHGTDLTRRLGEALGVPVGTYQGWFILSFKIHGTHYTSFKMRYTHGYGGGGPVTKDLIQLNRQLAVVEDADFFLSGHTHDAWYVPVQREMIGHDLIPRTREVAAIKIGGYKDEWEDGDGWANTMGRSPRPKGGWWVHFRSTTNGMVKYTVERCGD